jgi:hypothetical protein
MDFGIVALIMAALALAISIFGLFIRPRDRSK